MDDLILKKGNALTNHISVAIKGAGLSGRTLKGMKIAMKVLGHSKVPGLAVDAYGMAVNKFGEKMFGGFPVPGVVYVFKSKIRFEPHFISSALYKNVQSLEIDVQAIREVKKKQILSTSVIHLRLDDGECRIIDAYGLLGGGDQIVAAIERARRECPTSRSMEPPPLPESKGPPPLPEAVPTGSLAKPPPLPAKGPPPLPMKASALSSSKGPPPLPGDPSSPPVAKGPPPLPHD